MIEELKNAKETPSGGRRAKAGAAGRGGVVAQSRVPKAGRRAAAR